MATYSYEQFQKAAQDSGLLGTFSTSDLELARRNPDAGMSILRYKQDYNAATTDEARALANLGAESVRSSYGNYTGGADGSGFYLEPLSPSSFHAGTAPTYQNPYAGDIQDLWARQNSFDSYEYAGGAAPVYNNRYDATIQSLIGDILNREDFSYNPETDPLYSQYRKQYTREGQRATQDALGAAAAASEGIPSSYATTAAAQAGNYYASQLTDKIPELYELAYNKYLNDYNMQLSDLGVVQGAEQADYAKYLNELSQYNTDREFDYGTWLDEYNLARDRLQTAQALEQVGYDRYLNDLNQYNLDREFNYGQLLDEINSQTLERQEALDRALTAAEFGDFRGLQQQGINPDAQVLYDFNRTAAGSTGGSGGGSGAGTTYSQAELLSAWSKLKSNNGDLSKLKASEIEVLLTAGIIDGNGNPVRGTGSTAATESGTGTMQNSAAAWAGSGAIGTVESGDPVVDEYVRNARRNGYLNSRVLDELEQLERTGQINERQTSQILGRLGIR